MPRFLFFLSFTLISTLSVAQTDSVTITGRILNLTPRLYRQSPNVLISRNNVLQPNAELTRPAPLNPDGTYSVKMPIIYPQEEMYFSFASVSTAFLAAPGNLTIDLNADSLFRAAIPFQFGGVNARVNTQYARYKAFEARQPKINHEKLSTQVSSKDFVTAFSRLFTAYNEPLAKFTQSVERPFPLLQQWITGINRYNAASFLYDMAAYESRPIPHSLDDSLRPPTQPILTAARAMSMARLANYSTDVQPNSSQSLPVSELASLILRHGSNLSGTEQENLAQWKQAKTIKVTELRQMQRIVARSADTLQRLINYQVLVNKAKAHLDSNSVQIITAYWLASVLPGLTLNRAQLLYQYARPQLTDDRVIISLNELYRMAVGDSVRIREASKRINPNMGINVEVTPGVFVSRIDDVSGAGLLKSWLATNRAQLIYVLPWQSSEEGYRRQAALAQQLRDIYNPNEVALLYIGLPNDDSDLWPEYIVRNNLKGDHFLLTRAQYETMSVFNGFVPTEGALLIDRTGKVVKANVPLPEDLEGVKKQIERRLK